MEPKHAYFIMSAALVIAGIGLIVLALMRRRAVARTEMSAFRELPMELLHVNLVGKNLTGEAAAGPPSDSTSVVMARYRYQWNGRAFESRAIFPVEIEWMRPRISPLDLFEDLKSGARRTCFVDENNPQTAYMFVGWSPYLRRHTVGVLSAGMVVLAAGVFFAVVA